MTKRIIRWTGLAVLGATIAVALPVTASAQSAAARYTAAKAREDNVRKELAVTPASAPLAARTAVLTEARSIMAAYEALVKIYWKSGYADNALFNAGSLAASLHERYSLSTDRDAALRYYKRLRKEYPTAPLARQVVPDIARLEAIAEARAPVPPAPPAAPAMVTGIDRTVLPNAVRVTIALDREVQFHQEVIEGPARLFFDLKDTEAPPELARAVLRYPSDIVRQIRVGRHPDAIRVVLDFEQVARHSVYTLQDPFRIVIHAAGEKAGATAAAGATGATGALRAPIAPDAPIAPIAPDAPSAAAPVPLAAPVAPSGNTAGGFSIARQLGLGVSRVVIDPGHGGHDPGAQVKGLNEADLTLDVALRLEKLLQKEPGLEVVLTRRTNVYIPLEERTAIANREGADLFLSIHANTSRNKAARGVETYFLSFAGSPDAEAVAARENSANPGEMHKLPDLIKAITLNNKLDESRDFASMVQEALVSRLRRSSKAIHNRGVKKAPFVVLIGAEMPSVLAEVSFISNRQDLALLKTATFKQRIAEALHAAVMRYRRSLKGASAVAAQ